MRADDEMDGYRSMGWKDGLDGVDWVVEDVGMRRRGLDAESSG